MKEVIVLKPDINCLEKASELLTTMRGVISIWCNGREVFRGLRVHCELWLCDLAIKLMDEGLKGQD